MGDPGLASKFIEMQQEEAFAPSERYVKPDAYRESLRLDRSRVLAQLAHATHPNHIAVLQRALAAVESRIK